MRRRDFEYTVVEKEEPEEPQSKKSVTGKHRVILREWTLLLALMVVFLINSMGLVENLQLGKDHELVRAHLKEVEKINSLHYKKILELDVPMVYQELSGSVMLMNDFLNEKHTLVSAQLPSEFADYEQKINKLSHTSLCELDLDISKAMDSELDCS